MLDFDLRNPAPIVQTDIDLVRRMNPTQKQVRGLFETWPEWAKRDAQMVANYRRDLQSDSGPG